VLDGVYIMSHVPREGPSVALSAVTALGVRLRTAGSLQHCNHNIDRNRRSPPSRSLMVGRSCGKVHFGPYPQCLRRITAGESSRESHALISRQSSR